MNTDILNSVANFLKKRTIELLGLIFISIGVLLSISFISYSPSDPTLVYGSNDLPINNLLGFYGSLIADFLLQSFGLVSFLLLITIISWGINLIIKKSIEKILMKFFYILIYIIFSCVLINITFNNSFWLIDNGNSGFVGQILFDFIFNLFPQIKNEYSIFALLILSFTFFFLASSINLKYLFLLLLKQNKKNEQINESSLNEDEIKSIDNDGELKSQQTFEFEKEQEVITRSDKHANYKNFKLPSIELLEKNPTKLNLQDLNKNKPDPDFIEKILLDFGIDGNIKKINNGPVVSL